MDAAAAERLLGEAIIEQSPRQESSSPRLLLMVVIFTQKKEGGGGYFTAAATVISLVCSLFAELILTRFCPFPAGSGDNHLQAGPEPAPEESPQSQIHRPWTGICWWGGEPIRMLVASEVKNT